MSSWILSDSSPPMMEAVSASKSVPHNIPEDSIFPVTMVRILNYNVILITVFYHVLFFSSVFKQQSIPRLTPCGFL